MSYFAQNVLQEYDHGSTAEYMYGNYLPIAVNIILP